jgi:uncharacterized protein (TIGR00369 family)
MTALHNRRMTTHPRARRSADEQARLDAAMRRLHEEQITFNQTLGIRVVSMKTDDMRLEFEMKPAFVGHFQYGRLHGGVISAVLDTAGGFGLMVAIGERHPDETAEQVMHRFSRMATIDLRVDFLRQGMGKIFTAHAEVTRLGGRIGSTRTRLTNDEGTLIATGAAAYVIS